jgi:hypothetical protein
MGNTQQAGLGNARMRWWQRKGGGQIHWQCMVQIKAMHVLCMGKQAELGKA